MAKMTIGEAYNFNQSIDTDRQYIYIYSHEETYFYVGRSNDPFERLMQHLGKAPFSFFPDAIGELIKHHAPASFDTWQFEYLTLDEAAPHYFLNQKNPAWLADRGLADKIERAYIRKLRPCLNAQNNPNAQPLPDRYRTREISNEGTITFSVLPKFQYGARGGVVRALLPLRPCSSTLRNEHKRSIT